MSILDNIKNPSKQKEEASEVKQSSVKEEVEEKSEKEKI